MLSAVRITDMKEYAPNTEVDFDVIEAEEGATDKVDF
jgi:hypothetical protein